MNRRLAFAPLALSVLLLAGCTTITPELPASGDTEAQESGTGAVTSDDAIEAAVEVLTQRYELVRDGDFAAACELYTDGYITALAELAETPGADCVTAHEAGEESTAQYLETAAAQERAGLTPFFYVPMSIEIDRSKITSDDPAEAIASGGAVVSTDPTEFEDGVGKTPGWLSGVIYIVQGDDGAWRIAGPGGN